MKIKVKILAVLLIIMSLLSFANVGYAGNLSEGDKNNDVLVLQQRLVTLGYLESQYTTGFYGIITKAAVKAFQRDNKLPVTGVYDAATQKLLKSPVSNSNNSGNSTSSSASAKYGDKNNNVKQIQEKLIQLGYLKVAATGYFGELTHDAVVKFQRAKGLTADGIVGPKTREKLFSSSTSKSGMPSRIAKPGTLRLNDRGDEVYDLQIKLKSKGMFSSNATGFFGDITKNAVIKFQRASGLKADGIAGPQTLSKLNNGVTVSVASWRVNISNVKLSDKQKSDVRLIAQLIYAEARGEPYEGKVAVGNVVMNRVKKWSKSVHDTIYAHSGSTYQFTPAKTGAINNNPSQECIKAATEALLGAKPVGNCMYFINPKTNPNAWHAKHRTLYKQIGSHAFYI